MDEELRNNRDDSRCQVNEQDIGECLNCREYGVCHSLEGGHLICAGKYYDQAIELSQM